MKLWLGAVASLALATLAVCTVAGGWKWLCAVMLSMLSLSCVAQATGSDL